ncbi:AAEL017557-PA [Aedes aegypti]|uniref:Odorant receptor n=2 Tax=Aedes aegypti TaxID=7159 RepID=J9HFG7_AEDAE|nr:AAEL017557-PA [Aedes aegypti]DAA80371.1 TPA_exp: odorant receptor 24 [Aedes aegypti]
MGFLKRLNRFKIFQHSFKEPADFYAHQIKTPNMISKISGLNVFSEDFTVPNKFLFGILLLLGFYFYINAASAYEMRNDTEDLINSLTTFGIATQAASKLVIFIIFRKDLNWLHKYTEQLYREECNPRTRELLTDNVFLLSVILKTMMVGYGFTSFSLDVAPMLVLAFTGSKLLPFGFYIPHIDRFSWFGYIINYMVQIILTVFVTSEDMGPDCIYMIISMNAFTQIDLIIDSLKEVNRHIEAGDLEVDDHIIKIIQRHQEHLKYLRTVEIIFRMIFFASFVSLSSVLILSLFAVVTLGWYQGIVFILFVSYQLFFGCFLGTFLEFKNEQLQREIYTISWYKLSIKNQKSLRFLLQSAQEPVNWTLIFARLNIPTYLQVYKTIYSIFTMLLTVREE